LKGPLESSDRFTEALAEFREPRRTEHEKRDADDQKQVQGLKESLKHVPNLHCVHEVNSLRMAKR